MRLTNLKPADLNEDNKYVYMIDEGIVDEVITGRRMYSVTFWRLVMGRDHGEPVFEKVAEVLHQAEEQLIAEVQETLETNGWEPLEFTDKEFHDFTGSEMGYVTFDG